MSEPKGNIESLRDKIRRHEDNVKFLTSESYELEEYLLSLQGYYQKFLGIETMLAIVCKTHEGVKALEKYDELGNINSSSGIHGVGFSIGKKISGRFFVICIEDLREYFGGFIVDDHQKKLALLKPKLPNGACPNGFIDYAVNMIKLDSSYLSGLTINGHGLRETLFFSLFSQLQVYSTRTEMLLALPCITDGALSLDGGMITSIFALGDRKDVGVKFAVVSGETGVPADYSKTKEKMRMLKWERENIAKDIKREQELLELAKQNLSIELN